MPVEIEPFDISRPSTHDARARHELFAAVKRELRPR
jgi:hypothetical protein